MRIHLKGDAAMQYFVNRTDAACVSLEQAAQIAQATGLCTPVAALLCARGILTPQDAKRFLHPDPSHFLDPMLLPDMEQAVSRIHTALRRQEKITVFCDYDADGITGGCALYLFLRRAGADVYLSAPNRHKEGYGLSSEAVAQMAQDGISLIITVDCGITNTEETIIARSLGIDVIITDHHECESILPDTPYIINAKRSDNTYPDPNLSGCGVAFKLIHALSSLADAMRYIDLVAIGTITDIVPLIGENRAIAYFGLERLRKNPSAGIRALAQAAGIELEAANSYSVSFGLGPRINAAGRMDTAQLAIDILKEEKFGTKLIDDAATLCALNDSRKREVDGILEDAEAMIDAGGYHSEPVIMLGCADWNVGVIGIAAAKIAEKYTRPCVLFGGQPSLTGSARSIEGINIHEALAAFADRYEKFGGHAQAAGLTIDPGLLDELRRDVCSYIRAHYDESAFVQRRVYDILLGADGLPKRLVTDLQRFEPFGAGNEKPLIALTDAALVAPRYVGKKESSHLKFQIDKNGVSYDAIAFFYKDAHSFVPSRADFICEAAIDGYKDKPQLIVRDIAFLYSDTLKQSFIDAYAYRLRIGFLDEVVRLMTAGAPNALTDAQISDTIEKALSQSRFGLCLSVNSQAALDYLTALPTVRDALNERQLVLYDEKAYTPDNCIACIEAPGHARLLCIGTRPDALWSDTLKQAYRGLAKAFFAPRDELLALYAKLPALVAGRPRKPADLILRLGGDANKAAFALCVFTELELLDIDNNDRILALNSSGSRKELRQSPCYKGFEDLINE